VRVGDSGGPGGASTLLGGDDREERVVAIAWRST
jgi:hypothetical protein